jgi:NAD+ synthase
MSLDNNLKINAANIKSKIVDFIRLILKQRDTDGLVIVFSDCIESLINVHIAKEIVGLENVKLLVTKGRFIYKTPKEAMSLTEINRFMNLPEENIVFANKEGALREIGKIFYEKVPIFYDTSPVLNYNLSYYLLKSMVTTDIEEKTFAPPMKKPSSTRERFIQETIAYHKSQIRLGMLLAFLLAETENKSVIGSTNKTEWLLGFFTKFGTYHAMDFLPLANLYRTQVIQLAEHLELQDYLITKEFKRPPSYNFFFGLKSEEVDRILIRLESGFSVQDILQETDFSLNAIEKVNLYYQASSYTRTVPLIPKM